MLCPALTTHPDKGGPAEAFRAVVHAFETLIDVSRREAYDHLRRCPNKSSFAAGPVKKEVRPPKKRHGESNAEPANLAKSAKDKPKPARAALDGPRKKAKRPPPPATEPNSNMDCDPVGHADLFYLLLRLPKKQALKELEKLSEEALNAFAEFLESHEAEEILLKLSVSRPCKLRMPALKDVPKTTARMNSDARTAPAAPRFAKPRLKGISCHIRDGRYSAYIVLFPCFMTNVQCGKNLDTAIDMHISLVQMRQYVHAGLVEGKDCRQVLRDAIDTIQKERTAAGAEELRLRFRSSFRSGPDRGYRPDRTFASRGQRSSQGKGWNAAIARGGNGSQAEAPGFCKSQTRPPESHGRLFRHVSRRFGDRNCWERGAFRSSQKVCN